VKTRLDGDLLDTRYCFSDIFCEFGWSYMGEFGRLLGMFCREHQRNHKEGLMEKSELA
jgi:hypothetical protein